MDAPLHLAEPRGSLFLRPPGLIILVLQDLNVALRPSDCILSHGHRRRGCCCLECRLNSIEFFFRAGQSILDLLFILLQRTNISEQSLFLQLDRGLFKKRVLVAERIELIRKAGAEEGDDCRQTRA